MRSFIITILIVLTFKGCYYESEDERNLIQEDSKIWESNSMEENGMEGNSMEISNSIQVLMNIFGCSEQTAGSMCKKFERVVSGNISGIQEIPAEHYRIIQFEDESGNVYFAIVTSGYFVRKIMANSLDGEIVYEAIE